MPWDVVSVEALALLGLLAIGLWHTAFGRCKSCNFHREPRCGCSPDNSRKPWRNFGGKR